MSQIYSHLGRLGKTYGFFTEKETHKHFKIRSCYMSAGKFSRIGGDNHIPVHKPSKLRENSDIVLGQKGELFPL